MLSRLSARIPIFLRVTMTGLSALAVIAVGSAFTLNPASKPLGLASTTGASPSRTLTDTSSQLSREAAHFAYLAHLAHSAYTAHLAHVAHVEHLEYVASQAAAARTRARYTPAPTAVNVTPAPASQTVANTTAAVYQGSGSMQQCIISRESGGNSQAWNASGHYGLYQFSAATWAAHGGSAADFGHASVAEQNQVYYNTVAADGYSDWAPYDGC